MIEFDVLYHVCWNLYLDSHATRPRCDHSVDGRRVFVIALALRFVTWNSNYSS